MKAAMTGLAALALGGCVSLLPEPEPAPRLFALESRAAERATGQAPLDAVIAIARPGGERVLLGADLIWRTGDEIAVIGAARWAGRADELMQSLLIETITRDAVFAAAVRAGEARADYELRWDVLDFEVIEAGAAMNARFAAHARLIDLRNRAVVAARLVETEAPLAARSEKEAAQALARAAREGGARIASFAEETLRGAEPRAADSGS